MRAATSSAVPARLMGSVAVRPAIVAAGPAPAAASFGSRPSRHIGVSMTPGHTEFTSTSGARACAALRARLITAALDALYGAVKGPCILPAVDATMITRAG